MNPEDERTSREIHVLPLTKARKSLIYFILRGDLPWFKILEGLTSPPRRSIKNHFLASKYILFKVNSKYVVEFTSWALSAGNKIDIWLHKSFPHHFTMQNLSSNLNTVFRARNQPVRMVRMGALCIGIVWQPSIFSGDKTTFLPATKVPVGTIIATAIFQIGVDRGVFLRPNVRVYICWFRWTSFPYYLNYLISLSKHEGQVQSGKAK